MARKAAKNPTPAFFPGLDDGDAAPKARPLPPSIQGLFLPRLVAQAAGSMQLAAYADRREHARQVVRDWIGRLRAGLLHQLNESQVEQDFGSILLKSLGYTTSADVLPGQPWTMFPKWAVAGNGIVDVALGHFRPRDDGGRDDAPLVMVELKGAGTDLDRAGSRTRSAVQQAWDYLNAAESARWAIVSNFVEIRLYSRERSSKHVHRVLFDDLDDPDRFDEFFAVFHADSLLGTGALALNAARLVEETRQKQETVGAELYDAYAAQRVALLEEIRAARPDLGPDRSLEATQTLLDRILFVAFAEDRQLLPDRQTIEHAADARRPGSTRWRAFQDLFRALDHGDPYLGIPRFNGSLFKHHDLLDDPAFRLDDERWPQFFKTIGSYDFRDEVTVDILGRIFELSISDLEDLRTRGVEPHRAALAERRKATRQRNRQGAFYTNDHVTGYLVAAALEPAWEQNRAELLARHGLETDAFDDDKPVPPALAAFVRDRLAWLDGLTVCDPACGSGAFLVAAYDWFEDRRLRLLDDLKHAEPAAAEADGDRVEWAARSAPLILRDNLYGVDLSRESVEIARLSLWIRTARRGQPLTELSANVVCGNSVVDDKAVDESALDWHTTFEKVFAHGGFDVIVGNPPYLRHHHVIPFKDHFKSKFFTYHGLSDIYVYFYELGLNLLRPGGRLAFIVTNKWMRANYGESLRKLLTESAWIEQVVDFGHAKQFFDRDVDVFPSFVVLRKPDPSETAGQLTVAILSGEPFELNELSQQIAGHSYAIDQQRLGEDPWNLEPAGVAALLVKIRDAGAPLAQYAGIRPLIGIMSGLNEAYLIDNETRDRLVGADGACGGIIHPYLRGQDLERWHSEWNGLWLIGMGSSQSLAWPWAACSDESAAEDTFRKTYPSLHGHFKALEPQLRARFPQNQGKYWWELRSCNYWNAFSEAKIFYSDITWRQNFSLDRIGRFTNSTVYFIPSSDIWLLAVLNSAVGWWYAFRTAQHGKDEALRFMTSFIESFPVPEPSPGSLDEASKLVESLLQAAEAQQATNRQIRDWLKVVHDVEKPTTRLAEPLGLDTDAFVAEVRKSLGKRKELSSAKLNSLRDEHKRTIEPARALAAEARGLEARLNDLVNAAYGLTPDEVRLMWDTAPPRMPIARPADA